MASNRNKENDISVYAFITFLLTRSYAVMAILQKKGYIEDVTTNYKVEDFLWSGSGDGDNETDVNVADEDVWWQYTTTIIQTTTVMWTSTATVYRNKHQFTPSITIKPTNDSKNNCTEDTECSIKPTPTRKPTVTSVISPWPPPIQTEMPIADQIPPNPRYWLLTILKLTNSTSTQFVPADLQRHLANLYELAFRRHQEQHLGVNERWQNKARLRSRYILRKRRENQEQVVVRLHNVTSDQFLRIVYSVSVSGHPVLATTAARDMNYVSDAEVVAELGYPVFTKAEPFLKSNEPSSEQIVPGVSWKTKYSLLAASVTAILALVFCLLVVVVIKNCKKKPSKSVMSKDETHVQTSSGRPVPKHTGTGSDGRENETATDKAGKFKRQYSRDKSPEVQQVTGSSTEDSPDDSRLRVHSSTRPIASPHSYLSMPSVKEFPITPLPESLASVLSHTRQHSHGEQEPASATSKFSRHSSLGDDDPGVVGPVVWRTFRHQREDDQDNSAIPTDYISGRENDDIDLRDVRKRFNRLLDEALSLNSGEELSDEQNQLSTRRTIAEHYESTSSKSILRNREPPNQQPDSSHVQLRPYTSLNQRKDQRVLKMESGMGRARNAWCTNVPPTPIRMHSRPLSAGPFHRPTVNPEFILTDGQLPADDPAAPIISAIKRELDKIPKYEPRHPQKRSTTQRKTYSEV